MRANTVKFTSQWATYIASNVLRCSTVTPSGSSSLSSNCTVPRSRTTDDTSPRNCWCCSCTAVGMLDSRDPVWPPPRPPPSLAQPQQQQQQPNFDSRDPVWPSPRPPPSLAQPQQQQQQPNFDSRDPVWPSQRPPPSLVQPQQQPN